jgi:signal transduction histidine kinase
MDTNLAYKTNPRDQIPGLLMIAVGWILFLTSALNYRAVSWFNYLFYGRLLAFISAVGLVFIIALNKNSKFKDTWFYTMCLGLQAWHGILEGQSQTDFYSYTGLFYIIAALSTRCSLRDWLLKLFPLQILFLIAPLFFKSPQFFTSIAKFVDSFSLPVSGFIVGTIIVWINIQRFQTLIDNLRLKHELAESRHALLQKEKEKVQEIAFELEIAKNELIKYAENKAMVEVAAQVAHDIRSPLSALTMVIGMLKDLPKDKKELLLNATKRIDGIANDLLNKGH